MSKVLIVEDDTNLRDLYREIFELDGFTVEVAKDGREGIDKMASFLPEVVLLDIIMPKMSGFDVLKNVKNNPFLKDIPVLILTNIKIYEPDLIKNSGAAYFLIKTDVTPGEILEKVKELVNHGSKV